MGTEHPASSAGRRLILGFTGLCLLALSAPALADEATDERVRKLEEQVRELLEKNKKQEERIQTLEDQTAGNVDSDLKTEIDDYFSRLDDVTKWQSPKTFRTYWNWGLRFRSPDDGFWMAVGGRILLDMAGYWEDSGLKDALGTTSDDWEASTGFRQVRVDMRGRIFNNVQYQFQYEFAGSSQLSSFRHMWLGVKALPVIGDFRVGNLKEPISLEFATALLNTTFMERASLIALSPRFQAGMLLQNWAFNKRLYWELGVFGRGEDVTELGFADDLAVRFTGTPINDQDDVTILHLGVSGGRQQPEGDTFRIRSTPESFLAPDVLDTGEFEANASYLLGIETMLILHRFSFQAEAMWRRFESREANYPDFWGVYAYVSYFLTDDHRAFWVHRPSRVEPLDYWGDGSDGTGAFEVGLRYSYLDLDDGNISGGRLSDWTLGLNWYLNPNTRVMANLIYSDVKGVGNVTTFQMRFQIDF